MPPGFFDSPEPTMIRDNLRQIWTTIAQSAIKVGRNPDGIQLVAVSKTVAPELIQEAIECGQMLFGENYLQEAASKIPLFPRETNWHFIGHLQSNKARQAAELFQVIETVDRWKIAKVLDDHARHLGKSLSIFIQVNLGGEHQKSGIPPENAEQLLRQIARSTNLRVLGLMTMPPFFTHPEQSRPYFRELKKLSLQLAAKDLFADNTNVALSMGMSNDYPIAIEEGATIVRVGTALFGARNL